MTTSSCSARPASPGPLAPEVLLLPARSAAELPGPTGSGPAPATGAGTTGTAPQAIAGVEPNSHLLTGGEPGPGDRDRRPERVAVIVGWYFTVDTVTAKDTVTLDRASHTVTWTV